MYQKYCLEGLTDGEIIRCEPSEVITVAELAKMLRIGRNSAYNLVNNGLVRSVRVGSQIRISRASVLEFIGNEKSGES